jgi:hypothetical protein
MSNIFQTDDSKLIEKFIQGSNQLLANDRIRLEVNGTVSQLISRNGDPLALMYLQSKPRTVIVKQKSPFLASLDTSLQAQGFVHMGDASRVGFIEYKYYIAPSGYQVLYTDPAILWKKWWPTERFQNKRRFNMDILVRFKDNWYPIQDIVVSAGNFTIKTIAGQLLLNRDGKALWLAQIVEEKSIDPKQNDRPVPSTFTDLKTSQTEFFPEVHWRSLSPGESSCSTATQSLASLPEVIVEDRENLTEVLTQSPSTTIEELQQKLNAQLESNAEIQAKYKKMKQRASIAEQRLEVVYKYLAKLGISPQDIYQLK